MSNLINIWLIGNTGLRNPQRIAEGFKLYASSPFVGRLHGKENEYRFMRYLHDNGIINNKLEKDKSASHARKWRLMFARNGLIYQKLTSTEGKQEQLGEPDTITPFGYVFLRADTYAAQQECFLRAQSVEQKETYKKGFLFSPLRWVLALMIELQKRTGSSEITRTEFALWAQTTDPTDDLGKVVDHILDLRIRRNRAQSIKRFDQNERQERAKLYSKKGENFFDYADMNMRYLRITGLLQRRGRGLQIVPTKEDLAQALAKGTAIKRTILEAYQELDKGAALPSDNVVIARKMLRRVEKLANWQHIDYDVSDIELVDATNYNIARLRIENSIQLVNEVNYAAQQRDRWPEILDYMKLVENGGGTHGYGDSDKVIAVPKDEAPAYFEWILWRAMLAINTLVNKPYDVRGFKIDADFLPVSTAGGGRGDLYCEFKDYLILAEVTMSTSSRQEAMEGEPVRRHVSDAEDKYTKPVYGLFVAKKIDTNTAETFRKCIWYDREDHPRELNIVPLTLKQFRDFFKAMFEYGYNKPQYLKDLLIECTSGKHTCTAPEWKDFISLTVMNNIKRMQSHHFQLNQFNDK